MSRATLRQEQLRPTGQDHERVAGDVPDSIQKTANVNAILQAADEIQIEDPDVARTHAGVVPDSLQKTANVNAILQAADEIQIEDPDVARTHATLRQEQVRPIGQGLERVSSGIAGAVPDSLQNSTNGNAILQAADEIPNEDPNAARIRVLVEVMESLGKDTGPDGLGQLRTEELRRLKKTDATFFQSVESVVPRDLVRERDDKLGVEISPTRYLRECCDIFKGDTKSMHNTFVEVYMDFIEARKSPDSDEIKVESSLALSCFAQGDSEFGPNNRRIYDFLSEIIPNKEEREVKKELIERFKTYIMEIWPRAKVVSYGSFGSGMSLKKSDVDLTIFKNGLFKDADDVWSMKVDEGYANAALSGEKANFLLPIQNLMLEKGMLDVELISAKVPIVRCVDKKHHIDVDLSLYGIDGYLNTKFLACVQSFDQRISYLTAIVKYWAKTNNLNKTFEGSLSSYSYNLMVVNFCQIRGIAPVLHDSTKKTFKVKVEENICGFCEDNHGDMANKAKDSDRLTLYDLLKSFFHYWHQEYNYSDDVVSVRMGKTISRKESQCGDFRSKAENIIIEDPFDIQLNVSRAFKLVQLNKLRKEFATSARLLEAGADNWIYHYWPGAPKGWF